MDEIRLALRELKVKTVQECRLLEVRCSLPGLSIELDEYQDLADLIYDGNDLGYVLQEQGQGEPHFLEKFRAALEYEQCHDLKLALDIAENLNCYDYCPASDVEQFGEEVLQRQGEAVFRDPVLKGGIDLKAYPDPLCPQQYRQKTRFRIWNRQTDGLPGNRQSAVPVRLLVLRTLPQKSDRR